MIILTHDKSAYEPKKTIKYPWLGSTKYGLIILFSSSGHGTVLSTGGSGTHRVGDYESGWDMGVFTPLPEGESILLQNKWELLNE